MNDLYELAQANIALLRDTIKRRVSPPASEVVADNKDDWLCQA